MPKISIIVPVYGVEKYIHKCISSIINQSFDDFELIVINDETKDNSIEIIKENFNDKRIKIFDKKNGGAASARNLGIDKANGDYIFFVDSDDYIEKNTLEEMYNKAIEDNVDLVICDYYKLYENGEIEAVKMIPHYNKTNQKCSVISMPGPVCKLIKTSLIKENNITFLENHCFEDNAIMPFVCALAKNFSYLEKPLYYYLQREGSALNKNSYDPKWEDIFDSLEHLYQKFKDSNLFNEYYDELEYIYIEYLLHAPCLRFIKYKEGYNSIRKAGNILKEKFPNFRKNKYFKEENIKYKIICNLFYLNQIKIAKLLLRK